MESRAAKTVREIFESGRPLTYIRSSEEQRVARVLKEVGQNLRGTSALPIWTWSLTEGMRREGEAAPVLARLIRADCWTSSLRIQAPAHFSFEGFSRTAARIVRDPPPAARRVRKLPRSAQICGHHIAGPLRS